MKEWIKDNKRILLVGLLIGISIPLLIWFGFLWIALKYE